MKKVLTMLLLAAGAAVHSAPLSQSYDDYVKNVGWKHDDGLQVPKGVKIAPSREIDLSKSPFKREVKRLKIVQKKLRLANKKMKSKFQNSASTAKETFRHQKLRTQESLAKKQIVKKFNVLCGSEVPKIEKLNWIIRGLKTKIPNLEGKEKEIAQQVHDKHLAEAQAIIQKWVDNVFVYYNFPNDDTWDNKLYPSRNRSFYNTINKAVQKAIKKGGFAVAEDDREDEEEETGSEYTKKFTEISKNFLSEHFDVAASDKFNPNRNPFKAIHTTRINRLKKLGEAQAKNDTSDMKIRSGHRRETFKHKRTRQYTRTTGEIISRRFHKLLKKDFLAFERHVNQIRRWMRAMEQHAGKPQAEHAEKQYQRHVKEGSAILQKMIDQVFAHEPFPNNEQDYSVKSRYKTFYRDASALFYEG